MRLSKLPGLASRRQRQRRSADVVRFREEVLRVLESHGAEDVQLLDMHSYGVSKYAWNSLIRC